MKKIISLIMLVVMALSTLAINTLAYNENNNSKVIYMEDGSYLVVDIIEDATNARATSTKSGTKNLNYYSADDELLWKATLKGTFSYNGSSATCTAASITHTVYDSSWRITSATATKSSNQAIGNVTAKHYVLGIPIKTLEQSFKITCSANGTLS